MITDTAIKIMPYVKVVLEEQSHCEILRVESDISPSIASPKIKGRLWPMASENLPIKGTVYMHSRGAETQFANYVILYIQIK